MYCNTDLQVKRGTRIRFQAPLSIFSLMNLATDQDHDTQQEHYNGCDHKVFSLTLVALHSQRVKILIAKMDIIQNRCAIYP